MLRYVDFFHVSCRETPCKTAQTCRSSSVGTWIHLGRREKKRLRETGPCSWTNFSWSRVMVSDKNLFWCISCWPSTCNKKILTILIGLSHKIYYVWITILSGAPYEQSWSERCERTSERTSEWPRSSVCILGWFGPHCTSWMRHSEQIIIIVQNIHSQIRNNFK